jgi:pimeloyl-ACP methyl ester carboxylesterase
LIFEKNGLREIGMLLKWGKRIGLGLLCLIAVVLLGGASYQFISTKLDESKYPPPGQMVDVGGYRLHMHSMGIGGPTVVLDAGLGNIGVDWGLVQPEIAKFTRVVTYDRAGTGWSDKGPQPRTSAQIVQELHTLLHTANVPGPYIVVGHSFGGGNAQLFAATFPEEVVGVVLVDACHEAQERRMPPNPMEGGLMQKSIMVRLASTLGVNRLLVNMYTKGTTPPVPQPMWDTHMALCLTTKHWCSMYDEVSVLTLSLKQLEEANWSALAQKPCIVITAGQWHDLSALGLDEKNLKNYMEESIVVWNELQKELVAKFHDGRQVIAEKSDHMIPFHQPEVIVQAVQEIIEGNKQ